MKSKGLSMALVNPSLGCAMHSAWAYPSEWRGRQFTLTVEQRQFTKVIPGTDLEEDLCCNLRAGRCHIVGICVAFLAMSPALWLG